VVVRGADMPADASGRSAHLLVLDDISEIVSAQRARAWGEVARRLAHEIKNPLTPIQLSAERLEMKLGGKVAEPERAILAKSVRTIVDQVDAMKRLVNEFRDYARLPTAELLPVDLNELVSDVLQLYGRDAGDATATATLVPVRLELDPACPLILGDAIEGEAREVARVLGATALQVVRHGQPLPPRCVLLSGGETTVTVRGHGRGGRNVEFLLALAGVLRGQPGVHALAADTDGIDGAGPAAGALLGPDSWDRARQLGLDAAAMLADNDGHAFFERLGDSVTTGPTHTNVNDFRAILVDGPER
jgi:hypothetical protein